MKNSKTKFFNAYNIYILLWLFGYIQNMLINNSFVSLLFSLPFLGMTLYYIARVILVCHPKGVMAALSFFFLVMVVYGFLLLLLNDARGQERQSFLMMLFGSLGPIFSFYYFSKIGLLTEKRMISWLPVFLVVSIFSYYSFQQKGLALLAETTGKQYEEITNNVAYVFVGLLPFVFLLWKKTILQYVMIALVMFFAVSGMKRGAMIIGIIMIVWFVFVSSRFSPRGRRIGILLLTIAILIIGYRFVMQLYENSTYFQYRVESSSLGNSGDDIRSTLYSTFWNHFINNENVLQILFGEGAYHTENLMGYKAHNDWLELLIDCGFLGVLVYFIYWVAFVIVWLKSKKDYLVYSMLGACFIYTFVRTIFSMSFNDIPFYTSIILGYCFYWSNPIYNDVIKTNIQ